MIKELNGVKLRTGQVWQFVFEKYYTKYRIFIRENRWWGVVLISNAKYINALNEAPLDLESNQNSWLIKRKYMPPIKNPNKMAPIKSKTKKIDSSPRGKSKFSYKVKDCISNRIIECKPGQIWNYEFNYFQLVGVCENWNTQVYGQADPDYCWHAYYVDPKNNYKSKNLKSCKLWLGIEDQPNNSGWKFIRSEPQTVNGTLLEIGQIWIYDNRVYYQLVKQDAFNWIAREIKRTDKILPCEYDVPISLGFNYSNGKDWKLLTGTLKSKCNLCLQYE